MVSTLEIWIEILQPLLDHKKDSKEYQKDPLAKLIRDMFEQKSPEELLPHENVQLTGVQADRMQFLIELVRKMYPL